MNIYRKKSSLREEEIERGREGRRGGREEGKMAEERKRGNRFFPGLLR